MTSVPFAAAAVSLPRIAGLVPARALTGLPTSPVEASDLLGVDVHQLRPFVGGSFRAELDLPSGAWTFWPVWHTAIWIGRRNTSLPRSTPDPMLCRLDLVEAVRRLHAQGLWCLELRLRVNGEWSPNELAEVGLRHLVEGAGEVEGISGLWSGGSDGLARVELFADGSVWASSYSDAERWLLTALGLEDD